MSVTDGQHKVPIAIHRPAPSLLLARGDGAAEPGSRRPGPLQPQGPRPSPRRRSPGAHDPLRGRSWEGRSPAPRSWGPAAEADTGITLLQAPRGGVGGGRRGWRLRESTELLFLSPLSPQSELQAYMFKEKKIKNKENV